MNAPVADRRALAAPALPVEDRPEGASYNSSSAGFHTAPSCHPQEQTLLDIRNFGSSPRRGN